MQIPPKITGAPRAFKHWQEVANFLLEFAEIVRNAEGKNGIKVLVTDHNMVIEFDPDGGDQDGKGGTPSGGLPNGYGPEAFTICDSGTPVTRNFITDNPD